MIRGSLLLAILLLFFGIRAQADSPKVDVVG